MKIFLDTADTQVIENGYNTGLIDGITTNPTLIMKSGRDPENVYQELIDMGLEDVSMEVVGNSNEMIEEGIRLATKFPNSCTVKVPCTPDGLLACAELATKNLIGVNVTLIFDVANSAQASKPSGVQGTFTVHEFGNFVASLIPSSIISLELPTTSILTSSKPISISS
jgi:transaldolase